jgi:multiple sugar transport system substrate-binding protein
MARISRRHFLKIAGFATSTAAASRLLGVADKIAARGLFAEQVHLVLGSYVFGNVADVIKKLVGDYTAKNPNLTVDFEFADYSGFMDKLTTEIAAGTQPDIAMLIPDSLPKYYAQDLLLDLEPFVQAAKVDKSKWFDHAWEGLQFGPDKHHYAVPLTFDACVLWYNKNLFDKANIKYPDDTWDYDKLVEAAKALTVSQGGSTSQWGLGIGWEPWYQFMEMFGVKPWDGQNFQKSTFDTPAVIETIQKCADFYVKYKTTPVQPANSGLAVNGADVQFAAGNMAMLLGGTWNTQTYLDPSTGIKDFAFDNAFVPLAPGKKTPQTVGQPNVFVIFKSSKTPEEAWKLVNELVLSENGQNTLASAVEIPALRAAAEGTYKKDWLSKLGRPEVQVTTMDKYTSNVQFGLLDENTWMVEVDNQLDAVWKGADVAATCQTIAAKLNGLLDEARQKYTKK